MVRIADVAKQAGVSVATVSRVLNDSAGVRPELRERVQRAIADLNYRPSAIARSMRSQSVKVIGLIIADIQNAFFTSLVRAIEDVALENGYTVLLSNSDEDPEKERLYLDVLASERVAGAIVVPAGDRLDACGGDEGMALVMVDRRLTSGECDCVVLDNAGGTYAATRHLLELGHRHIGLLCLPEAVSVGWDRQEGYLDALRDHGVGVEPASICAAGFSEESGYAAAIRLLSADRRPSALIAANNLLTLGALRAVQERGLRIPEDVSIIGFDDLPWMRIWQPPLTVVSQPTYHIGAEAARLLFRRIREGRKGPPQTIVLPSELIVRGSTAPPSAQTGTPEANDGRA